MVVSEHILVAVDGSTMQSKVIDKAIEEAKLKKSVLTIVRILETPQYLMNSPRLMRLMERTKKFLEDELADIKKELTPLFPAEKLTTLVAYGDPKQTLVELAKNSPTIDLIVMGATGESEETLAGSTTTYVINLASCDVLVVR